MNDRVWIRAAKLAAFVLGLSAFAYFGIWEWMICRIEVPPGQSLLLRYKGPFPFAIGKVEQAPDGTLVKLDASGRPRQVGILEAMPGPGRHFYSPLEFESELVPDVIVDPGKIGLVTAKVGRSPAGGSYLVDNEEERGVWRRVLTPGRYRFNKYGYDVKLVDVDACVETRPRSAKRPGDPTLIPPGYVGVVTNKIGNPKTGEDQGIQDDILQPGIYFLNPEEKRVDIISVGFNETTQMVKTRDGSGIGGMNSRLGATTARDPEYLPDTGIEFPSNDGFPIHLDYTAIWGIMPDQAPDVVRQFGTLKDVEQKVILPQIGSICRLHGSKKGAVDLLVGDTREQFQTDTAEELSAVLTRKNLTLLFGLTRHIYVPNQVREPIQKARIAEELTKTREQEQLTAKAQADLSEAKAKVIQEQDRTKAETEKLIAQVTAEGEKKAREIEATTERARAEIDARTAIVQAQITKTLGEANARTVELSNQAEAERYSQYVHSLGGPDAYNRYVFAEGLPREMRLGVFYAGPGTFWTDLKGFEQVMLGKIAEESSTRPKTPVASRPMERRSVEVETTPIEGPAPVSRALVALVELTSLCPRLFLHYNFLIAPVAPSTRLQEPAMDHRPSEDLLDSSHTFPGTYQIKAIGMSDDNFVDRVVEAAIQELAAPGELDHKVRVTPNGRHVSLTLEMNVQSPEQVRAIYARLREVKGITLLF